MTIDTAPLFQRLVTGVHVIGVAGRERRSAFTATWVMPVSFEPPCLAVSINPHHASYPLLRDGKGFTVNVLARNQLSLARRFGTRSGAGKLDDINWTAGHTGAPLLDTAPVWLDCHTLSLSDAGDHVLVIGRIVDAMLRDPGAVPLLYPETGGMDGKGRDGGHPVRSV